MNTMDGGVVLPGDSIAADIAAQIEDAFIFGRPGPGPRLQWWLPIPKRDDRWPSKVGSG